MSVSIWAVITYLIFLLAMVLGLFICWRSQLKIDQKLFWAAIIILFPIAGTVLFIVLKPELEDSYT